MVILIETMFINHMCLQMRANLGYEHAHGLEDAKGNHHVESQLPRKIVNLLFTISLLYDKLTILRGR